MEKGKKEDFPQRNVVSHGMRKIRIEKVTVNIGCGRGGEKLDKAVKLLEKLTAKKVVITRTHKRTTFGVAKGRDIGCKLTLRGKHATEFLKRALEAVDNKISAKQFDKQGNFSLGVKEYIDLPGAKYDPDIGMYGMDVCVSLERPGFRVKRKRLARKIGKSHLITKEDAQEWVSKNFGVKIE